MSTIFKSELYSTFSNSTIMNKNKQVKWAILSREQYPLPQYPFSPKYSVTNLTLPEIPKIIAVYGSKR